MRVEQLTANIRFSSGMLLLKKAFPVRNSNTSSFIVSFISCKAQQCAPPAELAEKVPGVGLGVRQPSHLMDTLGSRAGSYTVHPTTCEGLEMPLGENTGTHFLAQLYLFLLFWKWHHDFPLFLSESGCEKLDSEHGFIRKVAPLCHFHPLCTELSQLCAYVCLVWWRSPDTKTWMLFLSGQVPFCLLSKCFSVALACLSIYLFLGDDAVSTRTVCALP